MTGNPEQKEYERWIFEVFRDAYPDLAAQLARIDQPHDDPPDLITTMRDGSCVGWELTEWLDRKQMGKAKRREARDAALAKAIRVGANTTVHIYLCMLTPKSVPFDNPDTEGFAEELNRLIFDVDASWASNPHWNSPQGYLCRDFRGYPTLDKYLDEAHFYPRVIERWDWPDELPWVILEPWGGAYDPRTVVNALVAVAVAKVKRYGNFGSRDTRLLVHYDRAAYYNTPFEGVAYRSFADVMPVVAGVLSRIGRVPFSKVYVLNVHEREAYAVYPALLRCA